MGAAASSTKSGQWVQCRFEGGVNCRYENYLLQSADDNAVKGLHSSWVTDEILAMQRPSTRLMKEHHIAQEFKNQRILAIINLQQRGEHKDCGDGVHRTSGFSYHNEDFHRLGIHTYNFGWQDMGTPSLDRLLDIVQVMDGAVRAGGKVAVHCHAGLGRTGLVIACFLVFSSSLPPHEAILKVRERRKGALQTRGQVRAVYKFAELLAGLRVIFTDKMDLRDKPFSVDNAVLRQRLLLHGEDRRVLRFTPKLVLMCVHRLLQLVEEGGGGAATFIAYEFLRAGSGGLSHDEIEKCKNAVASMNRDEWKFLESESSACLLAFYLMSWLEQLAPAAVDVHRLLERNTFEGLNQISPPSRSTASFCALFIAELPCTPLLKEKVAARLAWSLFLPPSLSKSQAASFCEEKSKYEVILERKHVIKAGNDANYQHLHDKNHHHGLGLGIFRNNNDNNNNNNNAHHNNNEDEINHFDIDDISWGEIADVLLRFPPRPWLEAARFVRKNVSNKHLSDDHHYPPSIPHHHEGEVSSSGLPSPTSSASILVHPSTGAATISSSSSASTAATLSTTTTTTTTTTAVGGGFRKERRASVEEESVVLSAGQEYFNSIAAEEREVDSFVHQKLSKSTVEQVAGENLIPIPHRIYEETEKQLESALAAEKDLKPDTIDECSPDVSILSPSNNNNNNNASASASASKFPLDLPALPTAALSSTSSSTGSSSVLPSPKRKTLKPLPAAK